MLVLLVAGLTPRILEAHAPNLRALAREGFSAPLDGVVPAVTCTAQATMLTGTLPREHGVVANGWYFRDLSQVWFWRQSNRLVRGEKVYETARRELGEGFTCAKLFWWWNLYAAVDWSVTPRPHYGSDGSKVFDVATEPPELGAELRGALGAFPFPAFWGPASGLPSSRWIRDATLEVLRRHRPSLTLVYLPHLDYDLQRHGPDTPEASRAAADVDALVAPLLELAREQGQEVLVLSEYGITPVTGPVYPNRALREAGWLRVRPGPFGEMLEPGASRALAVVDHQIAHVYVRRPEDLAAVRSRLASLEGVARVLDDAGKRAVGLDHERSGELVLLAAPDRWFAYPYWRDDRDAPDFARTVDIHRKPGYDPCELFLDPARPGIRMHAGWVLVKKRLGMRYRMDVVPLDARLVRGSHGLPPRDAAEGPVIVEGRGGEASDHVPMTAVKGRILAGLRREAARARSARTRSASHRPAGRPPRAGGTPRSIPLPREEPPG